MILVAVVYLCCSSFWSSRANRKSICLINSYHFNTASWLYFLEQHSVMGCCCCCCCVWRLLSSLLIFPFLILSSCFRQKTVRVVVLLLFLTSILALLLLLLLLLLLVFSIFILILKTRWWWWWWWCHRIFCLSIVFISFLHQLLSMMRFTNYGAAFRLIWHYRKHFGFLFCSLDFNMNCTATHFPEINEQTH